MKRFGIMALALVFLTGTVATPAFGQDAPKKEETPPENYWSVEGRRYLTVCIPKEIRRWKHDPHIIHQAAGSLAGRAG